MWLDAGSKKGSQCAAGALGSQPASGNSIKGIYGVDPKQKYGPYYMEQDVFYAVRWGGATTDGTAPALLRERRGLPGRRCLRGF